MLRYEARSTSTMAARRGLRIIDVGPNAELRDDAGHLRAVYAFQAGDIALVRPDGCLAALSHDEHNPVVAAYVDQLI